MNYNEEDLPGARHEGKLEGYSDTINSDKIISFEYYNNDYRVEVKKEEDKLHIKSSGGNINARDGSAFKLDYKIDDLEFMDTLQELVIKYNLSYNNGYVTEINGLPAGLGDTLVIDYESGEQIYHHSNQEQVMSKEVRDNIYNLFRELARKVGYDFNTDYSNVEIYDDATNDFLQGKWKGTHFGRDILVEFTDNHVKIYVNDKLTDDVDYIIINGDIRPDKLADGITIPEDEYDYQEFNGLTSLRKKNNILLTAYFTKDAYSTCDLLIQK